MSQPTRNCNLLLKDNVDPITVAGFGDEWSRFPQTKLTEHIRLKIFHDYFAVLPQEVLHASAVGADVGCGSGRWAQVVAPQVGLLHLVDASEEALSVARRNLSAFPNIKFHHASVDSLPFEDGSLDFAYSLGVLHHVPDTAAAIRDISKKLKPGAPLLLYLYYSFDNKSAAYRYLWKASDLLRKFVCRLPLPLRYAVSQVLAFIVYWPLARMAQILNRLGFLPAHWPLSYYRDKPLYVLRTDALDRFGTKLEQRFSRKQITGMMLEAGFGNITFSDHAPFWCVVGLKR